MVSGHGDDGGRQQQTPSTSPRKETSSSSAQCLNSRSTPSSPPRLERWERRIRDAKKSHRPRLRNWGSDRFGVEGSRAAAAFEALRDERGGVRGIAREAREDLTPEQFWRHYEKRRVPVVVSGIPVTEGWRAGYRWSLEQLDRRFRDCKLKCGEDDDGYSVKVKLKHFLRYMEHQTDDSPLYIFDSHFDDHDVAKGLLEDFAVPSYFPDDLFSLVGERRRPPYRWFLVGPKRSGTSVHIDPLGTSAWNTVVSGRKLWVVFPPHVDKNVAKGKDVIRQGEDDEPINYFVDLLPRIRRKYRDSIKIYEFVQYPGDTVFVPGGWWHAVLNLEDSVAITQNFCSRNNFEKVWRKTRTGRKKMSVKWLKELEKEHASLAETARRLNAEDGFVMMTKQESSRRRSSANRDSEGSGEKGNRKQKHGKRKGGGSDGSGSSGGGSGEDGGGSGRGNSTFKRGRKYGSDGSREGSLTPPPHSH
ncbi:unnamed protein product [Pylaiella littoralis]